MLLLPGACISLYCMCVWAFPRLLGAGFYCLSLSFLCNRCLCVCMCVCVRACSPQISVLLFFLVAYCNVASGFFCICFFEKLLFHRSLKDQQILLLNICMFTVRIKYVYVRALHYLAVMIFCFFVFTFIYLTRTYCGGSLQSTALQLKIPADRKMMQKYTNHNTTQHKG